MRIQKKRMIFWAVLCLAVLFALPVHAATKTPAAVTVKVVSDVTYLYDKTTDKPVTGFVGMKELPAGSGHYYFFKFADGQIYRSQLFKQSGKIYYATRHGYLRRGWLTIGTNRYYFSKKNCAAFKGWQTLGKKRYHFKKSGVQTLGWYKMKSGTYYLDPQYKGAKATGWRTIDKVTYYFNASTGKLKTGLVKIDGKIYYLNPKKNGARQTGWVTVNQKKYYMSKKSGRVGQAVIGWMKKNNAFYYFDSEGVMKTGWLTIGGKRYYLDPSTGKRVTGTKVIDGTTYNFGTGGYVNVTGPWSIRVNKGTCVVTVYRGDTPVKAMRCSVGNPTSLTPSGTFYLGVKHRWWELFGGVFGQYTSQITGNILFHSVFYRVNGNNYTLYTGEYNRLGSPASHGCVRLNVESAKYIYDNCPAGTKVTIFNGTSANDPLGKPALITATGSYDPTDPNL